MVCVDSLLSLAGRQRRDHTERVRLELKRVDVAVRRGGPRRVLGVLLFLAAVGAYGWTYGAGPQAVVIAAVATLSLLVGVGLFASASTGFVESRGVPGAITVDDDELRLRAGGRERRWPLSRVEGGWRHAALGSTQAVIRMKGGTAITVWADGTAGADALLMATTGARAARFPLDPTGSRSVERWLMAALLLVTPVMSMVLIGMLEIRELADAAAVVGALLAAATLGLVYLSRSLPLPSIVVGSEGVAWGRLRIRRRGYADLTRVERVGASVLLSGRSEGAWLETVNAEVAVALRERIEAARLAFDCEPPSLDFARLERAGRTPQDWHDDLSRVLDEASYRASSLSPDALLRIAEDARAEPERRVAASVALASRGQAQRQLRVAADRCAHPALRHALSRAARGELDLEAIEAAHEAHCHTPLAS